MFLLRDERASSSVLELVFLTMIFLENDAFELKGIKDKGEFSFGREFSTYIVW